MQATSRTVEIGSQFEVRSDGGFSWWTVVEDMGRFVLAENDRGRHRSFGRSFVLARVAAARAEADRLVASANLHRELAADRDLSAA